MIKDDNCIEEEEETSESSDDSPIVYVKSKPPV
jgi:hypothetical protein